MKRAVTFTSFHQTKNDVAIFMENNDIKQIRNKILLKSTKKKKIKFPPLELHEFCHVIKNTFKNKRLTQEQRKEFKNIEGIPTITESQVCLFVEFVCQSRFGCLFIQKIFTKFNKNIKIKTNWYSVNVLYSVLAAQVLLYIQQKYQIYK